MGTTRVQNGYKDKNEVSTIKFSDFLKLINKKQHRKDAFNREVFLEKLISSVYPSYKGSYSSETLKAVYQGNRQLQPTLIGCTEVFSINKAKSFFSEFLLSEKLPSLLQDFDITVVGVSFDMFCEACATQLKEFCTNQNEDIPDVMNSTCAKLKADGSYVGNKQIMPTDYELINEVGNLCPICRKEHLVIDGKKRNYNITLIYPFDIENSNPSLASILEAFYPKPSHVNEFGNEIATCLTCSNNYKENPTTEIYRKLKEKKISIQNERDLEETIDDIELEDSIRKIMNDLLKISRTESLTKLNFETLKISEKIPENDVNYDEVVMRVLKHYNFIDALMREYESKTTDGSTKLGKEIKDISDTLMKSGKTISEILERIANYILKNTTDNEKDLPYCRIIVAYFVQNCEVLSK